MSVILKEFVDILPTAESSVYNAALVSPYFLVIGFLSLPLFFMIYLYGRDFVERIGWSNRNYENQVGFWTGLAIALWLMLFGGDYAVIRDGISLLPTGISFVLFFLMIFVSQKMVQLNYVEKVDKKPLKWILFALLLLMATFSALPTWQGILLQVSAVFCGIITGCRLKKNIPVVPMLTVVMLIVLVFMLMQAEFFRFGKLGDLTWLHLVWVVLIGFLAVSVLTTRYVKACGKKKCSEIKALARMGSFLLVLLFAATQLSVPVFIFLMIFMGISAAITIRFSANKPSNFSGFLFGLLLFSFGILIICPLVSALGIVYMLYTPAHIKPKDIFSLL